MLRAGSRFARGQTPTSDGSVNRSKSDFELLEHLGDGEEAFELALDVLAKICPTLPTICRVEPWFNQVMHRCIFLYDLVAKVLNRGKTDIVDVVVVGMLYNTKELTKLLERDMSRTHPQHAKDLSRQLEILAQTVEIR